ncbi:MAG TPA: 3D domain-containing protein [Blastocatellia bacterium]|jgi:3D (Asp-Asp-Asp) domain-containing protein
MNQTPSRRFRKGLSQGLTILAIFAVGYAAGKEVVVAQTAESSPNAVNKTTNESIDIPGTFKNLPDVKDSVTQKRRADEINAAPSKPLSAEQMTVDTNKGVRATDYGDSELLDFHATAYCLKGITASGAPVRPGIIAADPRVLPLGTVVHIRAGKYTGTYTVLDTGSRIKGRVVDVYVPNYRAAKEFGRRQVKIKVISRAKRNASAARKSR